MNHKGFTLIEVLVVLVIIGILATLAIQKFREAQRKAKAQEHVTQVEPSPAVDTTASKRIQVVGWRTLQLGGYSPRVIIVLDSVSKTEYMIIQYEQSLAVTPIPKATSNSALAEVPSPGANLPGWKNNQ